jgi:pyruvate dehydrogenase E2 component (dihydrolipoamide acetyltransferase)
MATKVFMEALSPTMEEGRLVKWLKNEGDAVKNGDVLAEVETDKAIMELVARGEGVLRKRLVAENETRPVGQLVGIIAAPDENIDALLAGAGAPAPASVPAAAPASAPPAPAPAPPPPAAPSPASAQPQTPAPTPPPQPEMASGHVRSSPLARRLASERGLNLSGVQGSGPGGRIIKRDIESVAGQPAAAPTASARARSTGADFEDVPLTQIRKTIAKRLSESIGPIPTFYLTAEFDLTRAAEMRAAMHSRFR